MVTIGDCDSIGNGFEGNIDGKMLSCSLYQTKGLFIGLDNVVYVGSYITSPMII